MKGIYSMKVATATLSSSPEVFNSQCIFSGGASSSHQQDRYEHRERKEGHIMVLKSIGLGF